MDTQAIIAELEAERARLDKAITVLASTPVARGWGSGQKGRGGRRRLSAEARRKIALSAKKRWAKAKAAGRNSL